MAVISRAELENAQRDVTDLGKVVNGAADLANPGKPTGTVTTRQGAVVKTLSKLVADGTATVESLLTPLVYETEAAMQADKSALVNGQLKIKAGQTCYNRQTTQIYILTSVTVSGVTTRTWEQVSDLAQAASASWPEIVQQSTSIGRVSVDDYKVLRDFDRFLDKDAARTKFIKWPGKPTTGEGLAKALSAGATSWPDAPWGQEGTDFGCPTDLIPTLAAGNTHPAWTTPARILIKPDSVTKIVDGYNIAGGLVEVNNAVTEAAYVRNSIIDCNFLGLTGVQADGEAPIHIDRCTVRGYTAQGHNLVKGTVTNCLFENSKGDGMKGDFAFGGVIYNNMIRKLGQIDLSAHADGIQCQRAAGMRIFGNTVYMPGTGSTYDEGTNGSTQCLRLTTEANTYYLRDIIAAGNLLIGGGYTVAVRSRYLNGEVAVVENVIVANNILGGPNYHLFGHITAEHGKSTGSVGVIRNLLFHNNFDIAGNPMSYGGINQNGLWHYDKSKATPIFLELAKRWGYLDWNGDPKPGIANRTEVNQAAGTIP